MPEIDSALYDLAMRIAALSDFHIGSSVRADCFRHSAAEFHSFLDELEAEHDRIVLLGDIFQAEHGPLPGKASKARELRRAQARVSGLWSRFQGAGYDYLHGNHDACAALHGAKESLRIEHEGFGVFFVHGHQFDPLMGRMYPLAQASTWLSGRVRRFGLGPLADWLAGAQGHRDQAGTCSMRQRMFVSIDTLARSVELH